MSSLNLPYSLGRTLIEEFAEKLNESLTENVGHNGFKSEPSKNDFWYRSGEGRRTQKKEKTFLEEEFERCKKRLPSVSPRRKINPRYFANRYQEILARSQELVITDDPYGQFILGYLGYTSLEDFKKRSPKIREEIGHSLQNGQDEYSDQWVQLSLTFGYTTNEEVFSTEEIKSLIETIESKGYHVFSGYKNPKVYEKQKWPVLFDQVNTQIEQCDKFIFVHDGPNNSLIELGIAIAYQKDILIFTKEETELPYFVRGAAVQRRGSITIQEYKSVLNIIQWLNKLGI